MHVEAKYKGEEKERAKADSRKKVFCFCNIAAWL
jgi:hypothetical protein